MVRIEVGEAEEIKKNEDEQWNEKIKNWRSKAPINTQETEKELNLPPNPSFSKTNLEFINLYDQSPFNHTEEVVDNRRNIMAPRRNLGIQTDYQRRYQLERTTRTFLQNVFSAVEHSSLFQWLRGLSQKNWQNSEENQDGRINRRRRRNYGNSSYGNFGSGSRGYGGAGYGSNYNYGSNYSKQEAFIENLVTKWIQFRNSVIGATETTPEEEIRTDREFASDLADKIDRFSNQESRYFNRNPSYIQKPTFFQKFWKTFRNFFYMLFSGSKRLLFALVDYLFK